MSEQKSLQRLVTNRTSIVRDAAERLKINVKEVLRDEHRSGEDVAMLQRSCAALAQELHMLSYDLRSVSFEAAGADEIPTTHPMKLEA